MTEALESPEKASCRGLRYWHPWGCVNGGNRSFSHRLGWETTRCQGCHQDQSLLKPPPCSSTGTRRVGDKPRARTYTHRLDQADTTASPAPGDLCCAQARQQGTSPVPRRKKHSLHQRQAHLAVPCMCPLDFPLFTSRPSLPPHFPSPFLQHGQSLAGGIIPAKHEGSCQDKSEAVNNSCFHLFHHRPL